MFSDSLTSWDLGLEPNSFFTEKQENFFNDGVADNRVTDDALVEDLLMPSVSAPLELDIFEQELKRKEQEQLEAAKDNNIMMPSVATDSFMDEAFDNSLAVIEDPKMINSPDNTFSNNEVLHDDSGIDLNLTQEGTQDLIEEMESFLRQHEQQQEVAPAVASEEVKEETFDIVVSETPEEVQAPSASGLDLLKAVMEEVEMEVEEVPETSELTDEDNFQAEAILDALIQGDLTSGLEASNTAVADIEEIYEETPTTITRKEVVPENTSQNILDNINISNVSEIYGEDGRKILVVITKDAPGSSNNQVQQINLARPAETVLPVVQVTSEPEEDPEDSEWTPFSITMPKKAKTSSTAAAKPTKAVSAGRVAKQRGPYSKRAHANVKNKKERKKLQNVEAARRYRDKKKAEQSIVESEEDILAGKNRKLKAQLGEMENELKTLKKLMTELGLVK